MVRVETALFVREEWVLPDSALRWFEWKQTSGPTPPDNLVALADHELRALRRKAEETTRRYGYPA